MRKYKLCINDKDYQAEVLKITLDQADIMVNGKEYQIQIKDFVRSEAISPLKRNTEVQPGVVKKLNTEASESRVMTEGDEGVRAPLPGSILKLMVVEGQNVKSAQDLLIMEAMKMENNIQAPFDGTVKKIYVNSGDSVAEGDMLIEITRPLMTTL
jgi:biotin carboxyl carrier protein